MSSDTLTCLRADTLANPSLSPEDGAAKTTLGTSGPRLPASFAQYDPLTSSWKTSQGTLAWGSDEFLETWPRAGMTRSGTVYPLQPSAPLTDATGFLLWPTPNARDGNAFYFLPRLNAQVARRWGGFRDSGARVGQALTWHPAIALQGSGVLHPMFPECLMGFPPNWTQLE